MSVECTACWVCSVLPVECGVYCLLGVERGGGASGASRVEGCTDGKGSPDMQALASGASRLRPLWSRLCWKPTAGKGGAFCQSFCSARF
jgi:hypothetical protein